MPDMCYSNPSHTFAEEEYSAVSESNPMNPINTVNEFSSGSVGVTPRINGRSPRSPVKGDESGRSNTISEEKEDPTT